MEKEKLKILAGERAVESLQERILKENLTGELQMENELLLQQRYKVFSVELGSRDIIVAAAAGVLCGVLDGSFKSYVPKKGRLKHKHLTTRTAMDYKVPKAKGMKGSVQGFHRQIGPGHDIGRWREALNLMSGKTNDFPLWGKSIAEQTGGVLHAGNMRVDEFLNSGGFRIPADPRKELMNHLLIDFFTKTSLPIPYSSYIADYNELLGRIMVDMYEEGLNLKSAVGNVSSFLTLQLIIRGYVYLVKVLPEVGFYDKVKQVEKAEDLVRLIDRAKEVNEAYVRSREFQVLQVVAQGVFFLLDSTITMASKNYTGLFELNWTALLSCGVNVIKYFSGGAKEYKKLTKEMEKNSAAIAMEEKAWFESFKDEADRLLELEYFNEAFSVQLMQKRHEKVMHTLKAFNKKEE